ncbi:MAG: GAF domain-containing protein [Anaerolineae bacterium]|nr:GAF domain-containing protein [Anaerolineae bacterium]
MLTSITIALILNGLTLTIALGLLIIILWHDSRRLTNRYFAWFLFMMVTWASGSLLGRAAALAGLQSASDFTGRDPVFIRLGLRLLEIGFTSASLALYLYVTVLTGNRSRVFQMVGLSSVMLLFLFHLMVYLLEAPADYLVTASGALQYSFTPASTALFTTLNLITLGVAWQRFRKIQRASLIFGIMLFCLGQLTALFSVRLRTLGVAEDAGAVATFIMAFAIVQYQIIQPLTGKTRQIEVVRDVGLVITSRVELQNALQTIAAQATSLLRADASLVFLRGGDQDDMLILSAQYNFLDVFVGERLGLHEGLAGKVATERKPFMVNDYRRDWKGVPDTAFALERFGAVVGMPLIFDVEVVGVLLVISGAEGRLFDEEDIQVLNLLAPQAAVAIVNALLFQQQRGLTTQLEAAKNQLEAVLFSTNNPVIALNKRLEVIFANNAACLRLGGCDQEITHQNLRDLVPPGYLPQNIRQLFKDLKEVHSHVYELEIEGKIYLCHITRMQQPEPGWVAVLNDVTSLKELDRLQRQMIELMTHQLKNPLMGAMVHLEELEELGSSYLTEEMEYDIQVIREQLDRMERLIKRILNRQRIQNRSARFDQVDLSQVVRLVVAEHKPLAASKQVTLEMDIPDTFPSVSGDPERLQETISNLVDNAIKYTSSEGKINVCLRLDSSHALLSVSDTGIGIPAEHQARVFERFYRVEASGTERVAGMGMGLSLSKAIVEEHNGKIWLESEPRQGTTFYVSLPVIK